MLPVTGGIALVSGGERDEQIHKEVLLRDGGDVAGELPSRRRNRGVCEDARGEGENERHHEEQREKPVRRAAHGISSFALFFLV